MGINRLNCDFADFADYADTAKAFTAKAFVELPSRESICQKSFVGCAELLMPSEPSAKSAKSA
jgi:hypothetical protein